jgi:BASS family bile acid:Na+ symporter
MPVTGPIPWDLLTLAAAATVFAVMFVLGLRITLGEFRWVLRHRSLIARALFAVLVAVPAIALAVTRAFDLPRAVSIGVVLMSIAPGAPVALRRSLDAGGHRSFAPALQITLALLAVVSMPLSVSVLNEVYAGRASLEPWPVAKQVFVAQLLPLGIGMALRRWRPAAAEWLEPRLARAARVLLLLLVVLVLVDIWQVVWDAGPRRWVAIALVTVLALVVGHLLGGPEPTTRTAVAISSAARNPGLALLVATLNAASPEIIATVLAYLIVSALTIVPYVAWRRRVAAPLPDSAALHSGDPPQ